MRVLAIAIAAGVICRLLIPRVDLAVGWRRLQAATPRQPAQRCGECSLGAHREMWQVAELLGELALERGRELRSRSAAIVDLFFACEREQDLEELADRNAVSRFTASRLRSTTRSSAPTSRTSASAAVVQPPYGYSRSPTLLGAR
ncbi:MAG TPA: hypothetical protein VN213_08615 [Solirubrobacteraceae bacterium]|nr:hypothetical protein [Solirubrobacteraceae bacterium]